jgi:hypothetical protein
MRKILLAAVSIMVCGECPGLEPGTNSAIECTFQFSVEPVCSYRAGKVSVDVSLATMKLADDEVALTTANVTFEGRHYALSVSPDVSMLKGDVGIVSFADVNFDGIPDIAVSTSFGVANQYFDYWVYDRKSNGYRSVGNYPKLSANPVDKTLSARVKRSAADYQTLRYFWQGDRLIQGR